VSAGEASSGKLSGKLIQTDFTFLVRLTWVVPDKGPLNGCLCVAWRCELELTKRAAL